MPNGVARVYPASGATALLPLTPANNYTPTVIFCGGSAMTEFQYGDYRFPFSDTWNIPASYDCQRITPEPQDGSAPVYVQDDNMLEGRTMGQFIILPNGQLLVVNGGLNGTAGYSSNGTLTTTNPSQMPFGESLASGPVGQPAIYDPNAPAGSRWSNTGLSTSPIARLYHSSAILLPDASVLIAGSNPNIDVNLTTIYPTEYRAEIFYPPYFSASTRPVPQGIPTTLGYGGNPFDITIPPTSYSGSANDAADNTTVVITRGGFTTHAMNMGQRLLELNNTYTVKKDGSITLHVSQLPPNANLFQPGPAFLFVNVHGIPSNGTYVIVGNGQIGAQPIADASILPSSVRLNSASGSASNSTAGSDPSAVSKPSTAMLIGIVVGAIAVVGAIGSIIGIFVARRRRASERMADSFAYPMAPGKGGFGNGGGVRVSDSSSFMPLQQPNFSSAWNTSTGNFGPYSDSSTFREPSFDSGRPDSRPRQPTYDREPYSYSSSTVNMEPPKYGHRF